MKRREMLRIACAAAVGLSSFPPGWAAGAKNKRRKVLYFTRSAGYEHSVVRRQKGQLSHSEKVLTEMGKWSGFDVECTQDGRVFDQDLDPYDAIAFYTSGDLTRPNPQNTPPMSPAGKKRFLEAIAAGKGFVGFHAASDTFHTPGKPDENQTELDPYVAMLGGEVIRHGPQQEASLLMVSRFPGGASLGCAEGLSFYEEWYALKNYAKDLHVVFVQETDKMVGQCYQRPAYPATWARMHGKGRVFYTSLGHREDIWTNPFFQAITLGGLAWAMGNVRADVQPNLDKVTPHASQLKR